MPITPKSSIPRNVIVNTVEDILRESGIVVSVPPDTGKTKVGNLFVTFIEGNPRLQIEYEEEQ